MHSVLERASTSQSACCAQAVAATPTFFRQQRRFSGYCAPIRPTNRFQIDVAAAYAPSLPTPSSVPPAMTSSSGRQSLDPMASAWEQDWEPGRLLTVKSPEQFSELQQQHSEKLIVLMCKSHSCRPCKMFTRKYLSVVSPE